MCLFDGCDEVFRIDNVGESFNSIVLKTFGVDEHPVILFQVVTY